MVIGVKVLSRPALVVPDAAAIAVEPVDATVVDAGPPVDGNLVVIATDARRDARVAMPTRDAAPAIATPDAALPEAPADAAPLAPQMGTVSLTSDVWCDFSFDHEPPKRVPGGSGTMSVAMQAGHHFLGCEQPKTDRRWAQEIDVRADEVVKVHATLLKEFTVKLEVAATLNGKPFAAGASTIVKRGQLVIEVAGQPTKYATVTESCVVRAAPVDCYTR
jgi:hypothetical protein